MRILAYSALILGLVCSSSENISNGQQHACLLLRVDYSTGIEPRDSQEIYQERLSIYADGQATYVRFDSRKVMAHSWSKLSESETDLILGSISTDEFRRHDGDHGPIGGGGDCEGDFYALRSDCGGTWKSNWGCHQGPELLQNLADSLLERARLTFDGCRIAGDYAAAFWLLPDRAAAVESHATFSSIELCSVDVANDSVLQRVVSREGFYPVGRWSESYFGSVDSAQSGHLYLRWKGRIIDVTRLE